MCRSHHARAACIVLAALALPGCNMSNIKEHTGTLAGGVLGVVVGDAACRKQDMELRNLCRLTGAAMGAYLGKQIGDRLQEADRLRHAQATAEVLAADQARAQSTWTNASGGTSGKVSVTRQSQNEQLAQIPVLKDKVDAVPPLELIGEMYTTDTGVNVRVGPSSSYKASEPGLAPGAQFNVVGRVIDNPKWLMISQDGAAAGYVHADYVKPLGLGTVASETQPPAQASPVQVVTISTCKTVTHEIKYPDGQLQKESVDMCQQADGSWKLV